MKIKLACITCILAALFSARASNAAVVMTLEQVGPDVVATGSGTVNLTGLSFFSSTTVPSSPNIIPFLGALKEGNGGLYDIYTGTSGPANFGSGGPTDASTGTGNPLGIDGSATAIIVPSGYVSGAPLSSTATWNNTNLITDLGVTPGIYTWTWGSGGNADSLTLDIIAPTSVPEPAPALLLTLGAAAVVLLKRIKK